MRPTRGNDSDHRSPSRGVAAVSLCLLLLLSSGLLAHPSRAGPERSASAGSHAGTVDASVSPAIRPSANASPNLDGVWISDDDVLVRIDQAPGTTSIDSTVLLENCSWGNRSYLLKGDLQGEAFSGTIERCSSATSELVKNCSVPGIWDTPYFANVTEDLIDGQYRGEWWTWDVAADGHWVNCTLDHYFMVDFAFDRVDCPVLTFDQLAVDHASEVPDVASAVALATQFENGATLAWTDAQAAEGGLEDQVVVFRSALLSHGYSSTVNSAYRPVLYQAHFADLRDCNTRMERDVSDIPELAPFLSDSVAKINAEIDKHGLKGSVDTVAGIKFEIPFVCYREPLTNCPHVNGRGVDLSIPDAPNLDWFGALYGFCRPYAAAPVYWEYIGEDPWGNPKCSSAGTGIGSPDLRFEGNSPIDVLVTDANGDRVGYDPAAGAAVNDLGPDVAYYSGPGTHPQIITISGNVTSAGNYSVSGVGTGDGSYSVTVVAVGSSGELLDSANSTGTASPNASIAPVTFPLRSDYSPPSLWTVGLFTGSDAGGSSYSIEAQGSTYGIHVGGSGVGAVMFTPAGLAVALKNDGSAGSLSVRVPSGLLSGNITIRADGAPIQSTSTASGNDREFTFDRPAGSAVLTIEGTQALTGSPSSAGPGLSGYTSAILLVVVVGAVGAAIGVLLWRRRRPEPPPPPFQ